MEGYQAATHEIALFAKVGAMLAKQRTVATGLLFITLLYAFFARFDFQNTVQPSSARNERRAHCPLQFKSDLIAVRYTQLIPPAPR